MFRNAVGETNWPVNQYAKNKFLNVFLLFLKFKTKHHEQVKKQGYFSLTQPGLSALHSEHKTEMDRKVSPTEGGRLKNN